MKFRWPFAFLTLVVVLTAADQAWKEKQVAQWNEDDAKEVLSDSPWAKTATPTLEKAANDGQRRSSGGMGRRGGVGIGGVGIGLPGMGGIGRRPGTDDRTASQNTQPPPTLKLRWESAFPVREAELKARETSAPTVDEDHYAVAVYGLPSRMTRGDAQSLADQLKKQASLKREGKKSLKPSSVEVLEREDGPVILYLFPRSQEITRQDKRIEFDAQIGRFQLEQSFYTDDMVYQGKLEL